MSDLAVGQLLRFRAAVSRAVGPDVSLRIPSRQICCLFGEACNCGQRSTKFGVCAVCGRIGTTMQRLLFDIGQDRRIDNGIPRQRAFAR